MASSERFKDKTQAEALLAECRKASQAVLQKNERKEKTERPPALYDLTSLQRDANRLLGYSAQQTLDYTQALYEKKLVTYPRTDSRFLSEDMEPGSAGPGSTDRRPFRCDRRNSHPRRAGHQQQKDRRPPRNPAHQKHGES